MKILLASQSPRRQDLLSSLGVDFEIVKIQVDENYPPTLSPKEVPAFLSELKAKSYKNFLNPDELLITADTVVAAEHKILGKPKNEKQALEMLHLLSGKTHEVITAFSISTLKKTITQTDITKVTFEEINPQEMLYYIQNFRPYDKAGAYGIQEWIGMAKIKSISGSFYTVMGLPTHLVFNSLKDFDVLK